MPNDVKSNGDAKQELCGTRCAPLSNNTGDQIKERQVICYTVAFNFHEDLTMGHLTDILRHLQDQNHRVSVVGRLHYYV